MWFIGVEVEQETSAPPPKKNPGSAPAPHLSTPAMQALNARNYILTMTLRRAVVGPAIVSESLKLRLLLV